MKHFVLDSVDLSSHSFLSNANLLFIQSVSQSVNPSVIHASHVHGSVCDTVDGAISSVLPVLNSSGGRLALCVHTVNKTLIMKSVL